jgi:shikimate kinase
VVIVTLIGYRGSGKSSVARPLASELGCEWIDADAEIERRAGRSIREIFAEEGEPRFRELERQVMADLLGRKRLVIAAGGGAVLDPETRGRMRTAGPVVWLRASVETLAARVAADQTTAERRPNLTAAGGRTEIEELLARREPLYREAATLTIETDGLSIDEIVLRILQAIGRPAPEGSGT